MWTEGVNHWDERGDERGDNLLWNAERGRVMLIDFDRATLALGPANKPLLRIDGSKRKRTRDGSGGASFRGGVEVTLPAAFRLTGPSVVIGNYKCDHLIGV